MELGRLGRKKSIAPFEQHAKQTTFLSTCYRWDVGTVGFHDIESCRVRVNKKKLATETPSFLTS